MLALFANKLITSTRSLGLLQTFLFSILLTNYQSRQRLNYVNLPLAFEVERHSSCTCFSSHHWHAAQATFEMCWVPSSEFDPATEFEENLWFMTTFLTEHLVISGYPQVSQVYLTVFFK